MTSFSFYKNGAQTREMNEWQAKMPRGHNNGTQLVEEELKEAPGDQAGGPSRQKSVGGTYIHVGL